MSSWHCYSRCLVNKVVAFFDIWAYNIGINNKRGVSMDTNNKLNLTMLCDFYELTISRAR